jgi:quercetin dioxygenase-like cupin family protein
MNTPTACAAPHQQRIYRVADHLQPQRGEPLRTVITETADSVVVAWVVLPGQAIGKHVHPRGTDVWTVLSGQGLYQHQEGSAPLRLRSGDIAIASAGQLHGVLNDGEEMLVFVSVVAPLAAGYEPT